MHLPATRTLEALVATARLGSLAAAGAGIGMSVPALSRRLSALEKELGVRLLERMPRGVVPTAAGKTYLAHAAAVLNRLQAAAAELQRDAALVRVTTIPAFATRWLLPRLPAFADQNPGIDVDVRTSIDFERLDGGEFDYAVRLARDDEMATAPFLPIYLMPVWSAVRPFAIEHPADVLRYPLLGPDHRPEFWREWLENAGMEEAVDKLRGMDALLLYESALGGAGVAIGIEPLVSDLLKEGRLRGLETHRLRSTRSFFLLTSAAPPTQAVRLFGQWLRSQAQPS